MALLRVAAALRVLEEVGRRVGLDLAHLLGADADLVAVEPVKLAPDLGKVLQVREEVVARELAVDGRLLLLGLKLLEIHDHPPLVQPKPYALRARGRHNAQLHRHEELENEVLDHLRQTGGLVDAVDEHDQRPHLEGLHQHVAPTLIAHLGADVLEHQVRAGKRVARGPQPGELLHVDDERHQLHGLAGRRARE